MMHIIRLSGHIKSHKSREFEQNVRQIFGNLSTECMDYSISQETNDKGLYHIQLCWKYKDQRDRFMHSQDYKLLIGSFNVLGILNKKYIGEYEKSEN
jgi:hypothetical protein